MATTKSEQTYAELSQRVADGMQLSEAVRQLASETGRTESAIRASYYQQRTKLGHHGRNQPHLPKQRAVSVDDVIREARELLERARSDIEDEVAAAKQHLEAAQARYDALVASAAQRRSQLEQKIAAL